MGAVSRDIYKKGREYDEQYSYDKDGVTALLKDVYRLNSTMFYGGDIDTAVILADLDVAMNGEVLTVRQRQTIALHYFAKLTLEECAAVLGIDARVVRYHINGALNRIAANMSSGQTFSKGDPTHDLYITDELDKWLNAISAGLRIEEPSHAVFNAIANRFAERDYKSKEFVRQIAEGFVYLPEDEGPEYPCLSDEQMRWDDRRITYVEEVFPPGDVVGTRKLAIKNDEDSYGIEYRLEKRKLFKLRGN